MTDEKELYVTFAYDDPDNAPVEDSSPTLAEARKWMQGRSGYCYRFERLPDGAYGNETFVTVFPEPSSSAGARP